MEETEAIELLREINSVLSLYRVSNPALTRRSALELRDGYLEDLLQELSLIDEILANEWLEYDDTDLTGDYLFDGYSLDDIGRTPETHEYE